MSRPAEPGVYLSVIISAVDRGVKKAVKSINDGFKKSTKSLKVFNQAAAGGQKVLSSLTGQIKGLNNLLC